MEELVPIIVMLFVLFVVIWLYIILPAQMAETRNRSTVIWMLISLVGSPLLAILLLLVLGNVPSNEEN